MASMYTTNMHFAYVMSIKFPQVLGFELNCRVRVD